METESKENFECILAAAYSDVWTLCFAVRKILDEKEYTLDDCSEVGAANNFKDASRGFFIALAGERTKKLSVAMLSIQNSSVSNLFLSRANVLAVFGQIEFTPHILLTIYSSLGSQKK